MLIIPGVLKRILVFLRICNVYTTWFQIVNKTSNEGATQTGFLVHLYACCFLYCPLESISNQNGDKRIETFCVLQLAKAEFVVTV